MGIGPRCLLVIAALVPLASGAGAQGFFWSGYGQNADHASGLATGDNLALGFTGLRPGAGLSAVLGLPVDDATSNRWASLSAWFARPVPGAALGVNGGASVFGFADPILDSRGAGSILHLDGQATYRRAPVALRLRAGGRHGFQTRDGVGWSRLLGRAGAGVGYTAGALDVRAEVDHWRAGEGGYTQAGGRVSVVQPRAQLWLGVSRWFDESVAGTGWDVGGRFAVTDRVAIVARGGIQPEDILFWNPPQRTWLVALQIRTGAPPAAAALPVPVVRDGGRAVTLGVSADDAGDGAPSVAGTFSGWEPVPLRRVGDRWQLELTLEPGVHEYAFVRADGSWFVPEGTPGRKPDGFGGHVAMVIVQ